jgi:hypothetical protein
VALDAVNDAPSVWTATGGEGSLCWSDCTFAEDLGGSGAPATVYAGGTDVEGSDLALTVTAVTCASGSLFYADGTTRVLGGSGEPDVVVFAGALEPVFLFRPFENTSAAPYCSVTYAVSDGELDSADTPEEFTLAPYDIEGDEFTGRVMSCTSAAAGGRLSYTTDGGDSYVDIDCADLTDTPIILFAGTSPASWGFKYVPPEGASGDALMTVAIELDDGQGTTITEEDWYTVQIDVIAINDGPTVSSFDQSSAEETPFSKALATTTNNPIALGLDCDDPDSGGGWLTWDIVANGGSLSWSPDPDDINGGMILVLADSPLEISFMAPLDIVQASIGTMTWQVDEKGSYTVDVVVNDNGYTGVCPPDPDGTPSATIPCVLTASGRIMMTVH